MRILSVKHVSVSSSTFSIRRPEGAFVGKLQINPAEEIKEIPIAVAEQAFIIVHGCIRKLKNEISWDTFIWSIFEGSIDVSFAAFDIPQSCAFHSLTVELKYKDGTWKLRLVVSLCVSVYFWWTFMLSPKLVKFSCRPLNHYIASEACPKSVSWGAFMLKRCL